MKTKTKREPDFNNLIKILRREKPNRPTAFEFGIGGHVLSYYLGGDEPISDDVNSHHAYIAKGFFAAGYDYAPIRPFDSPIYDPISVERSKTISLNGRAAIIDEKSFHAFVWNDPEQCSMDRLGILKKILPDGGKYAVLGPGGIVENLIILVGFDNLCFMLYEDPALVEQISDEIGKRMLKYYEMAVGHESVGMLVHNDDWGFNTQSFFNEAQMRKYVFPWNKKVTDLAHKHHKPILLHSCGYFNGDLMDSVANELGYDGKHSFEDNITPVEEAYKLWHEKIAIIGGIDVNFLATQPDDAIAARCRGMLEIASAHGGYALGSGNSIPEYIPLRAFQAMMSVM